MNSQNPYYVLELDADASPGDIERHGRKLLGLLEIGAKKGATYTCPLGVFPRDATAVREAMATLRDPKKRAVQRCLARLLPREELPRGDAGGTNAAPPLACNEPDAPLRDAFLVGNYLGL